MANSIRAFSSEDQQFHGEGLGGVLGSRGCSCLQRLSDSIPLGIFHASPKAVFFISVKLLPDL